MNHAAGTRRGFTLIELLVAVLLTGIVCWMTLSLFGNEHLAYTKTREKVKLQSDSREAMRLMEVEVQNMGFRTAVEITSRYQGTVDTCTDVFMNAAGKDSSSFGFRNATTLAGDSIGFTFHELQNGALSTCTNLRTIGYRQSGSQLQRRWCSGVCGSEPWIPLLDSVVTFQVRYGYISGWPDTSTGFTQVALQTPAQWTGGTLTKTGAVASMDLGGWSSTVGRAIFASPVDSLDPNHSWEISFTATPNSAFESEFDDQSIRVGFFKSDGTVSGTGDTTTFYPGTSSHSRQCRILISPTTTSIGQRYLGFEGKLKTSSLSGWNLKISNITLQRSGRGSLSWTESPNLAQKNKTKAIKLNLLVKAKLATSEASVGSFDAEALGQSGLSFTPTGTDAKRSFVLFQRIIPVVNNGI